MEPGQAHPVKRSIARMPSEFKPGQAKPVKAKPVRARRANASKSVLDQARQGSTGQGQASQGQVLAKQGKQYGARPSPPSEEEYSENAKRI